MRNKHIVSTLVLSLGMSPLGLCSVLQIPTLENPVNVAPRASITASSVYQNEYAEFGTQKLVDGSTAPDRGNSWQAQGTLEGSGMRGTLPAWLIFDLQSDYTLSTVSFFNTVNYPHQDAGTKEFNIQVSSDGVNYSSPLISGQLEWQNQTYQDYSFSNPVSARYVQINLISAYVSTFNGLYNRVGLNEVQIKAVPEPSSLSLLALGGVVVALGRRKRA
jgi:hypothetical protein